MSYIPAKFIPGSSSATSNKIEMMDLDFERTVEVEEDYAVFFEDLNNPELLLEENI